MIKPQHFAALAIATAVSVLAAAGIYSMTNRFQTGRVEGQRLAPGLDRQEKAIAAVEISQGEKKVTLERNGEAWILKERSGYPVVADRVRALLTTIARAELIEPKTAVKDRHKQLELEDPAGKDAKSKAVRILDGKGKAISEVVLGKSRFDAFGSGKAGIYVRRLGEAQTWLATGDPKAGLEVRDWVATSLHELEQPKIAKLVLEHPGEEPLVVERVDPAKDKDAKDKFKLDKMPDGKKLKQGVSIDDFGRAFASIDLEDVRKLDATPTGDKVSVLKLTADGGMTLTFRLRKEGDANWLSFQAAGEGDAKKQADEANARATGWEFKIPQWKADQMMKRRADLFEAAS